MPEIQYVQANGLRFAYLEEGAGPMVLMLHGFPDTPHTWSKVRPAVAAAGFRVVTPFTRGYAPTEIPTKEDFGTETLARDALALIEALGASHAIVLGHDWGADTAFSMAGLMPERIKMLITSAIPHTASIIPTPRLLWTIRHFVTLRLPGAAKKIRDGNFAYIDELVKRWSPSWEVPPEETKAIKEAFAVPGCLEAALGYYRAASPILPASQKKKVEMPAAAFAGLNDNITPDLYERAKSRYKSSYEVVTVPGGHFMHREHPTAFINELLRLIAPFK